MRYAISLPMIIAGLLTSFTAQGADDNFELSLNEHKFTPSELTVPADKRIKLTIKNLDASAAEFESHNFKAEKVVPAGGKISIQVRPLSAGRYRFFDDYHEDTTEGFLVVK